MDFIYILLGQLLNVIPWFGSSNGWFECESFASLKTLSRKPIGTKLDKGKRVQMRHMPIWWSCIKTNEVKITSFPYSFFVISSFSASKCSSGSSCSSASALPRLQALDQIPSPLWFPWSHHLWYKIESNFENIWLH